MRGKIFHAIKRDRTLRILATVCFFVLLLLQYKLISGSYQIENREIAQKEKEVIKRLYGESIINDKLYPGGQKVLDRHLGEKHLIALERVYKHDKSRFDDSIRVVANHIVDDLVAKSVMDSLMSVLLKAIHLDLEKYGYALTLDHVALSFDGQHYIDVMLADNLVLPLRIAGEERYIHPTYMVSNISVTSYTPYSYRVQFTLYGLNLAQGLVVFKKIFPLLVLTTVCIFVIAATYILTFRRWQKQKKLNEITQDFLNSINHEFKTPISSISVSVKNLIRETKVYNNIRIDQSIQVIDRQSKRIDHLVDQAIGISIFNPNHVQKEYRNLTDDIENVVHDLRLKYIHRPDVILKFEATFHDVLATYDFFYLTTALNNLIENGVKHNDSEKKEVTVRLKDEKASILLEVSDNGEGIRRSELEDVFGKFYQGEQGREKGGLGLGLYYVDQMVKIHRWNRVISNRRSGGTLIKIIIPK